MSHIFSTDTTTGQALIQLLIQQGYMRCLDNGHVLCGKFAKTRLRYFSVDDTALKIKEKNMEKSD